MGGGATRAYNASKGLILSGCNVTVVAAFPNYPTGRTGGDYKRKLIQEEYFDGIRVVRTFVPPLPAKGLGNRIILFVSFMVSSILAITLVKNVDVIWAANPNIISMFPALFLGFLKRSKITMNVDDLWPEELYNIKLLKRDSFLSRVAEVLARAAYSRAHVITPISPGYVNSLSKDYHVDRRKIKVIRGGVDLQKFSADHPPRDLQNKFKILYVGSFSLAYDFDQVLTAAKILENRNDIEFILQGAGECAEQVKSSILERQATNVIMFDRILSRAGVSKALNEADILILPLRNFEKPYTGDSSKLYEYQASAKPIICCARGQPEEYVKKTRSGIVVKPGDPNSIANAVIHLKENPKIAEEMGNNGRRYVSENLSLEEIGRKMKKVFELMQ